MPESAEPRPVARHRGRAGLLAVWSVLAAVVVLFAKQNLSVPGLYYDEAVFGGLAKDFVTGRGQGQHMPDHETSIVFGRPFPMFVQTYLGALKSWMLIPAFYVAGSTMPVLRATSLILALVALLLLMLAARRWLGSSIAILSGTLLALDPTFFFLSVLDWGVAVPSLLCRCACFYFAILFFQRRKAYDAFLIGLFAGLGFFDKADFAVVLMAIVLATIACYGREIVAALRQHSSSLALACLGFAIGGGPMLLKVPRILALTVSGPHPNAPGEFGVKLKTMLSMYDGSHFYRLMNVGGVFERMYGGAAGPRHFLGITLLIGCLAFAGVGKKIERRRALTFLILAAILTTLGVLIMPDAVRIHHAVLVYPLPHLITATLIVAFWNMRRPRKNLDYAISAIIALVVFGLIAGEIHAIADNEQLIRETGGRGRWSESLNEFCRENQNRTDSSIVSLDWGFNEQLLFLTDGPQLAEPFWDFNQTLPPLSADPNYVYLVHPAEYSVLKYDVAYLTLLENSGTNVEVMPHRDRQGEIAFYTIRFRSQ
jgi:uncharacterized membrane protein